VKEFKPKCIKQFKTRVDAEGRECTSCGIYKPWDDYLGATKSYTGKQSRCKICHRKNRKSQGRKKELYSAKKHRASLKKEDPHLWRASNIRSSLMNRARKLGLDRSEIHD